MPISCSAVNCTNRKIKGSNLSFFHFPLLNHNLTKEWVLAMKREKWSPTKYSFLCSDHFQEKHIRHNNDRRYLQPNAVPTVFNFPTHLGLFPKVCKRPIPRKRTRDREEELEHAVQDEDPLVLPDHLVPHINLEVLDCNEEVLDNVKQEPPDPERTWMDVGQHSQGSIIPMPKLPGETNNTGGDLLQSNSPTTTREPHGNEVLPDVHYVRVKQEPAEPETSSRLLTNSPTTTREPHRDEVLPDVHYVQVKQEPIDSENSSHSLGDYPTNACEPHEILPDLHFVRVKQEPIESDSSSHELADYPTADSEPHEVLPDVKEDPDEPGTSSVDLSQFCQPVLLQSDQDKEQKDTQGMLPRPQHKKFIEFDRSGRFVQLDKRGRKKLWGCDQCDARFVHRCYLVKHEQIHSGLKPFGCNDCDKKFTYRSNLERHVKIHSGLKPYACKDCDKKFSLRHHLKQHEMVHTGEKPYACTECDLKFTQLINLKTHMDVHTEVEVFSCQMCSKWFIDDVCLTKHSDLDTGTTFYVCDKCDYKFTDTSKLAVRDNDSS